MRQVLDSRRRVFIHDYDGVHYDYAVFPDVYSFLGDVKLSILEKLCPEIFTVLEPEEIKHIGVENYHSTGDGLRGFVEFAVRHLGADEAQFQRDIHILYNQTNMQRTLAQYSSVFDICPATNSLLDSLSGPVRHGMVTQSCLENWAIPGLKRQERFDYFEKNAFVGFAEGGYVTKSHSTRPLETIIRLMKAKPEEVVFIEDSLKNLKKAKELDERILTVHICHDEKCLVPDYVDLQFSKLPHFLKNASNLFAAPRRENASTIGFELHA